MFYFWREATAALVPGFLCQSGRRRPENASILSSLFWYSEDLNMQFSSSLNRFLWRTPESQDRFARRQLLWPDFSL